jgi:16S rRNA (cytosine967-C5)-methyltransferase
VTTARDVAAHVLARVDADGAFAAAALQSELARSAQLDERDRALATELVYGSLRLLPWLVARIEQYADRGVGRLDARTRAHLVLAAYQVLFTRVPAFAAVNEAVGAIRATRGPRLAAFANAVLRKLAAGTPALDDAARARALVESAPAWLREGLERALGEEGGRAFLLAGLGAPPIGLRVERAGERDLLMARLREAAPKASFEPGRVSPLAIVARGAGNPEKLPGWREGAWSVQEEGAQLAALALGAREGEVVLDACAGRGNKTALLARAVGPSGAVDACDVSAPKLDRLGLELARLGLRPRATYAVDWTVGSGDVTGVYDRILVDAPCSGTGTLRRRPEIALRRDGGSLEALCAAQVTLAARVAGHLRPGGTLLYVVCSVLREECEQVVEGLLRARPELRPARFEAPAARAVAGESPCFRLLPHVHGTDGYFVARFVRSKDRVDGGSAD